MFVTRCGAWCAGTAIAAAVWLAASVHAQETRPLWHKPASTRLNNLTNAIHGNGVYGFIYNSSKTPDQDYGTYNWCNMPHVRRSEYPLPPDEFELQYVELIHRHHKRTPYAANSFPTESYHWDCNDVELYLYGQPTDGHKAARAYRQGYTSPVNPFVSSGWTGTCSFPQITAQGLTDSWQHGADLYGVYRDLLHFLPERGSDFESSVRYRVTNNVITSQVAGMVINGMWGVTDPIPLLTQAPGVDSLEPQYSCPNGAEQLRSIQSDHNPEWQKHLDDTAELFRTLDNISGVKPDDNGFHMSFDHYYDNLSARQCHDKPLPCKISGGKNTTTCVTQNIADTVYRLGNWEYSQIYRDHPSSLAACSSTFGVWLGELTRHLRDFIHGERSVIYYHNVAHDGSVSRLLSVLQIKEMVWPGMGSEVVFELYRRRAGSMTLQTGVQSACVSDYYIRVLFSGQVLNSSDPALGRMDMVPLRTFLRYMDALVGKDADQVEAECAQT